MCRNCVFHFRNNVGYLVGKLEYSSTNSVQNVDCVNLIYITKSSIYLNATVLFNPNLLTLSLISLLVCKTNYIQNPIFYTLINSRSTYCSIDTTFALKYNIPTKPTPLVKLKYFDRLLNITLLDSFCSLVLRYNQFTQHNLTGLLGLLLSSQTYEKELAFSKLSQYLQLLKTFYLVSSTSILNCQICEAQILVFLFNILFLFLFDLCFYFELRVRVRVIKIMQLHISHSR